MGSLPALFCINENASDPERITAAGHKGISWGSQAAQGAQSREDDGMEFIGLLPEQRGVIDEMKQDD